MALFRNLFLRFRRGSPISIIEIFDDEVRLTTALFLSGGKELRVLHSRALPFSDIRSLAATLRKMGGVFPKNAIVALGSRFATTLYSAVSVVRQNPEALIDEPDLENIVSQTIWKFFDRHRGRIAAKLSVPETDVILTDARILTVRLDGHKVVNPLGFRARVVEVGFAQTFLSREVSDALRAALPVDRIALITEAGSAWLHALTFKESAARFTLARIGVFGSDYFIADGAQCGFKESINWGMEELSMQLGKALNLDIPTAESILVKYFSGNCSNAFLRRLETILLEGLTALARGLGLALKRAGTKVVYFYSSDDLPPIIFTSAFRKRMGGPATLQLALPGMIADKLDFRLSFDVQGDEHNAFPLLAYFFEWRHSPFHELLGQVVRRRVRWLSPIKSN